LVELDPQKTVFGLLALIIAGLFGWRGLNKVGTDNARANRESRFEDNLQKRYDALTAANSELREECAQLREECVRLKDGRALLERRILERDRKIASLLAMMGPSERKQAERWMPDSAFAPFDGPGKK